MADDIQDPDEDPTGLPIVYTSAQADAHDWTCAGLVRLEGRWIRPVLYLQEHLSSETADGTMARALEALLTGLVHHEPCLILTGLSRATMAASILTLPAGQGQAVTVVVADEPTPPVLRLVRGGRKLPDPGVPPVSETP